MSHEPIPVSEAQRVAETFGYDQLIIVGWNAETGATQITTFGTEPAYKKQAAQGGDRVAAALGLGKMTVHEDYAGPREERPAEEAVDCP